MSKLGQVVESIEKHNKFVLDQVKRARTDEKFGRELLGRWNDTKAKIPVSRTPTGLPLPRLALPEIDEPGEIARYLFAEGLPGEFPFLNGAYREMYLEPIREVESFEKNGEPVAASGASKSEAAATCHQAEEPTRLFSGLMLAEDTNERFHYLTQHQRTHRLSTAFDGPTLYGIDSDADGVFGKIGEGGVAIDTVEDMVRLYDGFDLGSPNFSASMTISGPAPIIMAMYIAAAKRRFGQKLFQSCATIQADFQRSPGTERKRFSRSKHRCVFLLTWLSSPHGKCRVGIRFRSADTTSAKPVRHRSASRLYALQWFRLCGNVRSARSLGRPIRAAPLVFSRLWSRCGIDCVRSRIVVHLGNRNAGCVWRRTTSAALQIAYPYQRSLADRSRIHKHAHRHCGRANARLHERDEFVSFKTACGGMSSTTPSEEWIRLAAHGQAMPPGRVRHFQTHHEYVQRFAGDESRRALGGSGHPRRVS